MKKLFTILALFAGFGLAVPAFADDPPTKPVKAKKVVKKRVKKAKVAKKVTKKATKKVTKKAVKKRVKKAKEE